MGAALWEVRVWQAAERHGLGEHRATYQPARRAGLGELWVAAAAFAAPGLAAGIAGYVEISVLPWILFGLASAYVWRVGKYAGSRLDIFQSGVVVTSSGGLAVFRWDSSTVLQRAVLRHRRNAPPAVRYGYVLIEPVRALHRSRLLASVDPNDRAHCRPYGRPRTGLPALRTMGSDGRAARARRPAPARVRRAPRRPSHLVRQRHGEPGLAGG